VVVHLRRKHRRVGHPRGSLAKFADAEDGRDRDRGEKARKTDGKKGAEGGRRHANLSAAAVRGGTSAPPGSRDALGLRSAKVVLYPGAEESESAAGACAVEHSLSIYSVADLICLIVIEIEVGDCEPRAADVDDGASVEIIASLSLFMRSALATSWFRTHWMVAFLSRLFNEDLDLTIEEDVCPIGVLEDVRLSACHQIRRILEIIQ